MNLHPTPENPLPPGAQCVPVTARDGTTLRAMVAQVPQARGTVVMLGGRGDYMERYFETAREVAARGYTVVALDVRGQGGSDRLLRNRLRGHVHSFSDHVDDLWALMATVVLPHCPRPYYGLGHSTGGNILLQAIRRHSWFSRSVVVAPLIGLDYGRWPPPVVRVLVFLATNLGLGWLYLPGQQRFPLGRDDFPGNPLSSDRRRWERDSRTLEVAPQLATGGPTFSWLKAAMASTGGLQAMGPRDGFNGSVLMVAAGLERVVDAAAIERLAARVPGVSLVTIRDSLHEILTERDDVRAQFFAAFDAFLGGD